MNLFRPVLVAGLLLAAPAGFAAKEPTVITSAPVEQINYATLVSDSLARAVEKVLPSVVVIRTEATKVYLDFWQARRHRMDLPVGQGSGVIVDEKGLILTNSHVLQGAQRISVILEDGRELPAKFVGSNPQTDIAVLQIDGPDDAIYPSAQLADSDAVRVGEICLAIGSPFSLSSTVTQGIVSHTGREASILPIVDFLQTSAPINPGNSGGPLVNTEGKVIGINTFIQTPAPNVQGNIGIGFAVPAKVALRMMDLIVKGKNAELPWVGIVMLTDREEQIFRARYGLSGVLVKEVMPDSPAARAGLKSGDLVTSLDGRPMENNDALRTYVLLKQAGETMAVDAVRDGKSLTASLTTSRMPNLRELYNKK